MPGNALRIDQDVPTGEQERADPESGGNDHALFVTPRADRKEFRNDAERAAFLFELYRRYTSLLPRAAAKTPARARGSAG